ncbi:restriction of telomere capping protein 5 [Podospora australis]|uniref:Restriction of telomere capping protein 5 n=1 Tax=Podospora australis TaxID=1536484 RepID=A0AAN6WTE8_9PEZI|nr:restriction of telomere capping protein 5 [Podospora australis]
MGQAQSDEKRAPPSHEELAKELANKFAEKCFTPLELYSFKEVFKNLADQEQTVRYLKEDTIARYLEIPDALGASPVLFQMMSYLGAFPFLRDAPAVLGVEQMVIVITIMTERYQRVLAKGATDRRKLLFKSLAVYDRKLTEITRSEDDQVSNKGDGFAVDAAGDDEGDDDADELVLAALDSMDYINAITYGNAPTINGAIIPTDNWRRLLMLLLLIAPLNPQESLSWYSNRIVGGGLESLRATADCILASFVEAEAAPRIKFTRFNDVIPASLPYIFNGLAPLFEHFLFAKDLDFHKRRDEKPVSSTLPPEVVQPLLQDTGSIMDLNLMSQLSFFIPGESLFRRLRLLYSGDEDGFSMGSFESKVFNWRAPTILLVSGTRLPHGNEYKTKGAEAGFLSTLPSKRFPSGSHGSDQKLTFGVYLKHPWKHTHRECFGDEDTVLFQLQPIHDVFRASKGNKDYASFMKPSPSTPIGGVAFGCPPPQPTQAYRRANVFALGPVSLVLDSSFEFGCFQHHYTSHGGAFQPSIARKFDFDDRFEISSIEVWGCGGDAEAKHQAERWAWEAREAEARRRINLGTGDIEADRALLEMAGLIGGNRSGGSMM